MFDYSAAPCLSVTINTSQRKLSSLTKVPRLFCILIQIPKTHFEKVTYRYSVALMEAVINEQIKIIC